MNDVHDGEKGLVVVPDASEAGAIVWWRLSGGLDLKALTEAWSFHNLPHDWLPSEPSFQVALRRAVNEMRDAHRLVRTLRDGGLAVVDETEVDGEPVYSTRLTVTLDKVGRPRFGKVSSTTEETQVRLDFERFQNELIQADVSPWLCGLMEQLDAVALRDTGGIYFVPRYQMGIWRRMVEALRASSPHHVAFVPALSSKEATTAILDALAQEARRAVDGMRRELDGGDLKSRALQNRIDATNAHQKKLSAYEHLFGAQLAEVHAAIDELKAELTVAMTLSDDDGQQQLAV